MEKYLRVFGVFLPLLALTAKADNCFNNENATCSNQSPFVLDGRPCYTCNCDIGGIGYKCCPNTETPKGCNTRVQAWTQFQTRARAFLGSELAQNGRSWNQNFGPNTGLQLDSDSEPSPDDSTNMNVSQMLLNATVSLVYSLNT